MASGMLVDMYELESSVLEGKGNAFLHSSLLPAGSVVHVWAAMPTAILEHELEVTDGGTT